MSSTLRKIQKQKSGKKRKGLTSRGKTPGPAQTPKKPDTNTRARGFRILKDHDLTAAKPSCGHCHGTGSPGNHVIGYDNQKRAVARRLVCSCVPDPVGAQ
jgi:hypothetical protein